MSTICAYAVFKTLGVGANSLTVTWDVDRITRADGTRSALVTGGANSIAFGRRGKYGYLLAGADLITYDYVFTAITADTSVDQKEMDALWTLWSLSWSDLPTAGMSIAGSFGKYVIDSFTSVLARIPDALTANGNMKSSLLEIIATALSEGAAGRIAAAWQGFWNVTSPVATAQNVNQAGDNYARLGAPAGVSIAADIAAISGDITVNATVAVSSTEAGNVSRGILSITAGYTFRQTIYSNSMDDLSAATKLWVAIKNDNDVADSASDLFIEKTAGLTVLRGASYGTPAHGSLTVSGVAGAWEIAVYAHETATSLLYGIGSIPRVAGLKYTKAVTGDDPPAWNGQAVVVDGIVRATG